MRKKKSFKGRRYELGERVYYHPIINHPERFSGTIVTEPWPLGNDMVCHVELDDGRRIHAACFDALERIDK